MSDSKKQGFYGLTSHLKNHYLDIKLTPESSGNPKSDERANSNKRKTVPIFNIRAKKTKN